jgi:Uncharacterised protein family (UPF0236)
VYFVCRHCRLGGHPADERLGVSGGRTRQAERLLCLAGGSWSFDRAAQLLKEFCGLRVSDNTIRAVCQGRGGHMADWQHTQPAASQTFREASGEVEFETDGTCVNTREGWREVRLGVFAKRHAAAAAEPEAWDQRRLPRPTATMRFAAIERGQRFVKRWSRWLGRLSIGTKTRVYVAADGAPWIWQGVEDHLSQADSILDIYHALEHVASAARALEGEGTQAAAAWRDQAQGILLEEGWPGISAWLHQQRTTRRKPAHRQALAHLLGYLKRHALRLDYRGRLAAGRTIGSGMVEGACKHVIGRRLKQAGARWRVRRLNRMATLCCHLQSSTWELYWSTAA